MTRIWHRLRTVLLSLAVVVAPAATWADDNDPIESVNRGVFWFNDKMDVYLLEPVARGWDYVAPERLQQCVSNFFDNVRFPVVAINNALQGKFVPAASDVGRFVVNTTAGLAGFFDPASDLGLERHQEDFGQTLGVWGVPPGPYLMVPVMGPFTLRDGVGYFVDIPLAVYPLFSTWIYTLGPRILDTVNWRAQSLETVARAKEASLDYYAFVRNAYLQRREALIHDREEVPQEHEDDLYFEEGNDE